MPQTCQMPMKGFLDSMKNKYYLCIDLKSFYASVECRDRGLDPLNTNLVVADKSRTEKTICLAVTPTLKAFGLSGRSRLFEVVQKVKEINARRRHQAPHGQLHGSSYDARELRENKSLGVDYIVAPPRMARYIQCSTEIYNIYLEHVSHEDIHPYSIDEVFIDITPYLRLSGLSPHDFAKKIIRDVYTKTQITATAGIGTNMYLAKVAMDIVAKHIPADEDGVRIAELDELSYRETLWSHRPLTDFWRVGHGYAQKLEKQGLYTMGDIALCSVGDSADYYNSKLLYKLFGVNAELLIDHAWGCEMCTIADIKSYRPQTSSLNSGQVLTCPYSSDKARLIVREMADSLALDLVARDAVTDRIELTVGYDVENLKNNNSHYDGEITTDRYGRSIPKHAHGTQRLEIMTSSSTLITEAAVKLYDRIINKALSIRRINITACDLKPRSQAISQQPYEQISLFDDVDAIIKEQENKKAELEREQKLQKTVIDIKNKYGKNSIVKGMNLEEGATAMTRNKQIGGHSE